MNYSNWIFVVYPVGAYGSVLAHLINNVLTSSHDTEVFNSVGAAHRRITSCVSNFHTGDSIDFWVQLSPESRMEYFVKNLVPTSDPTAIKLHRIASPNFIVPWLELTTAAKIVNIYIDKEEYWEAIANNFCNKTGPGEGHNSSWEQKFCTDRPALKTWFNKLSQKEKKMFYMKQAVLPRLDFLKTFNVRHTDAQVYNFNFSNFYSRLQFWGEVKKLVNFLKIGEVDANMVNELYNKFAVINNIK